MNIHRLEQWINPVILERGRKYLHDGHVSSLEEVEELVYQAEVEGSETYEVDIELDSNGEVVSAQCDCPYDAGDVCKHIAAVLLELAETVGPNEHIAAISGDKLDKNGDSTGNKKSLNDILSEQDKDKLVSILLALAGESRDVDIRLRMHFSEPGGAEQLKQFRKLIRSYIKSNSEKGGFVPYHNVSRAVKGAEMVYEKAQEAFQAGRFIGSVQISLLIMEEMADLLQACDDSDGNVGGWIEECLHLVGEVVQEYESMSEADLGTMFMLLIKATELPCLEGWSDWQLELLSCASELVRTAALRMKWEDQVSRLMSGMEKGYSSKYFAGKTALLKHELIRRFDGNEHADEYIAAHIGEHDAFREMAIRSALQRGDYATVIRLAEEGETLDKQRGYPGLVTKWKNLRNEAYRASDQTDKFRSLAEELLAGGDYDYYAMLKQSYGEAEWPEVYNRILQLTSQSGSGYYGSGVYTRILVEEKETALLMKYVQENPHQLDQYYPTLVNEFPNEIYAMFRERIIRDADQSNNCNGYKKVCDIIRKLYKAGGREEAREVVRRLELKYQNRPAFQDELSLLKLS